MNQIPAVFGFVAGSHLAITALSLNSFLFSAPIEKDLHLEPVKNLRLKTLTRLNGEIYRGIRRTIQIKGLYSESCELDTPIFSMKGPEEVNKYAMFLRSLKPVQLAFLAYEVGDTVAEIQLGVEYTVFSKTVVIPLNIHIQVDTEGKIVKHCETWNQKFGITAQPVWSYPSRRLNGLILSGILSLKS